jgi:hypothetical protein
MAEVKSHYTPDFTVKQDVNKAKAAQKKVESLKEKEASLVEELREVRKEMNVQSAAAKLSAEPGFSNAVSNKEAEAKEESKTTASTAKK